MSTVSHELEQLQLICDIYQSEIDVLNIHKNVDNTSLSEDAVLYKVQRLVREKIIRHVANSSFRTFRSPDIDRNRERAGSSFYKFERSRTTYRLDQLLAKYYSIPVNNLLTFNSCSASYDCVVKSLATLFKKGTSHKLGLFVQYFELPMETKYLSSSDLPYQQYGQISDLYADIDNLSIIVLESVSDIALQLINVDNLVDTVNSRKSNKPLFIIIDSTLNDKINYQDLITRFSVPVSVIVINSGSKILQLGFEFSNLGTLRFYTNLPKKFWHILKPKIQLSRDLTNSAVPDFDERLLLPILKHPQILNQHIDCLYKNSVKLDHILEPNKGKFKTVFYSHGISPYVLFQLRTSKASDCVTFVHSLRDFIKLNNSYVSSGDSFGFRHVRVQPMFKVSMPDQSISSVIRISAGSYSGDNYHLIHDFIDSYKAV